MLNDDDAAELTEDDDTLDPSSSVPLRSAPQDSAAALNAAAMVRKVREQQKMSALMATDSPTRAMDALAGGSAVGAR